MATKDLNKEIPLEKLQDKYAGKLIALSKNRARVLASAYDSKQLIKILQTKRINLKKVSFLGPIPQPGKTYVY